MDAETDELLTIGEDLDVRFGAVRHHVDRGLELGERLLGPVAEQELGSATDAVQRGGSESALNQPGDLFDEGGDQHVDVDADQHAAQ